MKLHNKRYQVTTLLVVHCHLACEVIVLRGVFFTISGRDWFYCTSYQCLLRLQLGMLRPDHTMQLVAYNSFQNHLFDSSIIVQKNLIIQIASCEQAFMRTPPGMIFARVEFTASGMRVCATDQGRFFTSKIQNRFRILKFSSRTCPDFLSFTPERDQFLIICSGTSKMPVAFMKKYKQTNFCCL